MTKATRAQTLAWAKSLYVCAFGRDPEAVWHTTSLRSEQPLSFFFRHQQGLCAGAIGLSLPDEEARTAESLRVFMAFQHRFEALSAAGVLPPEIALRSLPLLRGRDGVVVARGQGGWLALADEDIPATPAPWSLGQQFWLSLRLPAPPREDLIVVFPQRGADPFEVTIESACGRLRRGIVDVDRGALWLQPASAGDNARADVVSPVPTAATARISVMLTSCDWRSPADGPRTLTLRLGPAPHHQASASEAQAVASSRAGARLGVRRTQDEWVLVSQGQRVGLRYLGRGRSERDGSRSQVSGEPAFDVGTTEAAVFDARVVG